MNTKRKYMIGKKFGMLLGEKETEERSKSGTIKYICNCDCGNTVTVDGTSLRNGNTKSCGCLQKSLAKSMCVKRNTVHGMANTRLYRLWSDIKRRCYNKSDVSYKFYGGRGIKMCEEWRNDFKVFADWAYKTGYDITAQRGEYTIERINVNEDYSAENCTWKTIVEQQRNKRSTKKYLYNGEYYTLSELENLSGIKSTTLFNRIKYMGMSINKAVETPVMKCSNG